MSKQRKRRREYRFIGFKVYAESDQDILAWWEAIDEGQRSDTIRDLIRERLGLETRRKRQPDLRELVEVREDTAWIRRALSDMPAWLESYLHELAARPTVQLTPAVQAPAGATGMADNESQRRSKRIQERGW
ncbi:MAG TPA: hypothetical protein PLQ56_21060 [Aggregatilineales bacterium]|nr:hypothetical protein [Aggregatilineales bacterium]